MHNISSAMKTRSMVSSIHRKTRMPKIDIVLGSGTTLGLSASVLPKWQGAGLRLLLIIAASRTKEHWAL